MSSKETYHKYQQVLDSNNQLVKITRAMKRKFKKSRNGCLNCKRRKKKCDEQKPSCEGCIRNSLECLWPAHVNSNPNISANPVKDNVAMKENNGMKPQEYNPNFQIVQGESFYPIMNNMPEKSEFLVDEELQESISEYKTLFKFNDDFVLDQFLDMNSENISLIKRAKDNTPILPSKNSPLAFSPEFSIPGLKMTERDLACYEEFVNILIASLTYPHSDPDFTPTKIIIPFVKDNYIVREVALACGASLLAYHQDCFKEEASQRYNKVISLIIKELQDPKANYMDHLFVSVQLLQTLCLRDKNVGFNITLSSAHFSSSYAIIKKRFLRNMLPICRSDQNPCKIRPLDRLLMDHFILLYPLNIMLCRSSKSTVPSPFKFFATFYHVMKQPVCSYEISDPWKNHPILGAGLKTHEIAVKCAWICRFFKLPLSEDDMITYFGLLVETTNELKRLLKLLIDFPDLKPSYKENIYLSRAILYACLIILKKVCYYEKTTIESLQDTVNLLINEEEKARELSLNGVSSLWAMFIGASSSTTVKQKRFFSKTLKKMANGLHSTICLKILNYLNIVWVDELNEDYEYIGFDFLFDSAVLDIITN